MELWLNLATIVAYIALTLGVIFQIRTVYRRKSAEDIEIIEVVGRFFAQVLIMWKMVVVSDEALIIGHLIITLVYSGYLFLVIKYKYYNKV